MLDGIPPQEVLQELAQLLEAARADGVIVYQRRGVEHRWYVTAATVRHSNGNGSGKLCQMERNILLAACEHSDERLTGEQLAKLAGYEPNARFRSTLARLRHLKLLSGEPGDAGYQATDGAFERLKELDA